MAIEFKDYYKILGVSKDATEDELRKAFRKLARLYHPDVAKNKAGSEDKFKEVNEAYEVLGDPGKRKKYDEYGQYYKSAGAGRGGVPPGWQEFGGGGGGRGQPQTGEFQFDGTGFSDFFEQLFGAMGGSRPGRGGAFRAGRNASPDFNEPSVAQKGDDLEADLLVSLEEAVNGALRPISVRRQVRCAKCFGAGQVNGHTCPECQGSGHTERADSYKVKIPPGVRENQVLRVAKQGEAGIAGGPPGDLFLKVRFAKHPDFRVEENQLYYDLEIAPWEGVLGETVSVPTLSGKISIKIPPGTQNGTKMRLRGRGIPAATGSPAGDIVVVVRVQVPKTVTPMEKELWEKLAKESAFHARE